MLKPFKDRVIDLDRTVRVYRNLNAKTFSIQQDGLVKAHGANFILRDFTFVINEAGRQRCLRDRRKNVHAYAQGFLIDEPSASLISGLEPLIPATYNPYRGPVLTSGVGFDWQGHVLDIKNYKTAFFVENKHCSPMFVTMEEV